MRTRLDLFIITALSVYRLWRLVARDAITQRWREQIYNRWPPDAARAHGIMRWSPDLRESVYSARPVSRPRPKVSWFAKAVDCPWCSGAWLCAVATLAVDASFGVVWPLAWWAALSAAVGLLGRLEGGKKPVTQ
jgi:hypothetical protein